MEKNYGRVVSLLMYFAFSLQAVALPQKNSKIDSLERSLLTAKQDTNKLKTVIRLYYRYLDLDIDQAQTYAEEGLELAKIIGSPIWLSEAYSVRGHLASYRSKYIDAKGYYKKSLEIAQEARDTVGISSAAFNLGTAYDQLGDYVHALEMYQESLMVAEKLNRAGAISGILTNIGVLYSNQNDFPNAIKFFERALKIEEARGDKVDKKIIALILGNIGTIYHDQNKYEEALDYFNRSLSIEEGTGNNRMIAWVKLNIGSLYNKMGEYDLALENVRPALITYIDLKDQMSQSFAYLNLAEIFASQKLYRLALENYIKSNDLALKIGELKGIKHSYKGLASTYASLGQYEKAYNYHKEFKAIQDSLMSMERNKQFNELVAVYESDQKEREIEGLQKDQQLTGLEIAQQKNQKNILILATSLLFLLVIFVLAFSLQLKRNKTKLETINEQLVASELQLSKLNETKDRFFAIIAHDLRGAITSFQGIGQVIKNHLQNNRLERINNVAERIDNSASHLNSLLDNLLNWAVTQLGNIPFNPRKLNLRGAVEDAIVIFGETAKAKNIQVTSNVPEDIYVKADENGLSVVLRNLINNALKFTESGGNISLEACRSSDLISVTIRDSGIGIPESKLKSLFLIDENKSTEGTKGERGTGLGLSLCHEFIKLHKGDITVESEVGLGTTFNFSLPTA